LAGRRVQPAGRAGEGAGGGRQGPPPRDGAAQEPPVAALETAGEIQESSRTKECRAACGAATMGGFRGGRERPFWPLRDVPPLRLKKVCGRSRHRAMGVSGGVASALSVRRAKCPPEIKGGHMAKSEGAVVPPVP